MNDFRTVVIQELGGVRVVEVSQDIRPFQRGVLQLTGASPAPAINTDLYETVNITGQGSIAIASFSANLTGTPSDGDKLRISVTGSGAVGLTWGSSFEASNTQLPTTTIAGIRLDIGFFWNSETSKWRCIGVS